jgi:anti-sigma factor ChrR (cupin superfamily)
MPDIRAQFSQREVVRPADYEWVPSPMKGVERMMLDRVGDEIARATSLVRYAPESSFLSHQHGGGEEIYVLDGVFADEAGVYPAGTYIRNPIGSSHSPKVGKEGATLFVKLHQFAQNDTQACVVNCLTAPWRPGLVEGLSVMPLHSFETEHVALVRWQPNTQFQRHTHWGGEEIFVLDGTFYDEKGVYPKGTWLRSPHLSEHRPFTREDGALIYVKVGHLAETTLTR